MSKRSRLIEFFEEYEANFNAAILCEAEGIEATAAAFASSLVAADPSGVWCSRNDDTFRQRLKDDCRFYRQVGTRAMRLEGIDTTPIDPQHVMARVHWLGEYRRDDGTDVDIRFDVVYFVRMLGDVVRIFGSVAGDTKREMRENGLFGGAGARV